MSTFDEREPFKKRIVATSLTADQRAEFDRLKVALNLTTDGAVVKAALAMLSKATLSEEEDK